MEKKYAGITDAEAMAIIEKSHLWSLMPDREYHYEVILPLLTYCVAKLNEKVGIDTAN